VALKPIILLLILWVVVVSDIVYVISFAVVSRSPAHVAEGTS